MRPRLQTHSVDLDTLQGRALLRGLDLTVEREQVAIIGRNGVGKSSLLALLAGTLQPTRGAVQRHGILRMVPQDLSGVDVSSLLAHTREATSRDRGLASAWSREADAAGLPPPHDLRVPSRGQLRKLLLISAMLDEPDFLLLDEPGSDLDEAGHTWLIERISAWTEGLLVVSHDPAVLGLFSHFVQVAEAGCRYLPGPLQAVEVQLEAEQATEQAKYLSSLHQLGVAEARTANIRYRRRRKRAQGRNRELGRCTPRSTLNAKRSYKQMTQAKAAAVCAHRIGLARKAGTAARRGLAVNLPLDTTMPELPAVAGAAIVQLRGVGLELGGRRLFSGVDLVIRRERIGVTGANGTGKTSLLRVIRQELRPTEGQARGRLEAMGHIAQGATDWMSPHSLLWHLQPGLPDPADLADLLTRHRFPLALAERALSSLSPGERVRAALICLFSRAPPAQVLVLDEPTFSLDLTGRRALTAALRAWPGGLVVASHDRDFLDAIGLEEHVQLGTS